MLPSFLLFSRQMEGNIKVKVQINGIIAIHQGDTTVTIHPLKMCGFMQDLGLAKRRATQLKPEKIRIDELSYQPEKLYAEPLLDVFSKAISEKINTTLKNECMACYDPVLKIHSCYLNNPRGKVDRNFDNALQFVDFWSANKMTFEKTEDKFQVAVKDRDLYLTHPDLMRNKCIFHRSIESCCNEISFVNTKVFFFYFLFFVSLFIFPCFNGKYFQLIYCSNIFL